MSGNVKTARQEYELLVARSGEHNVDLLNYIRLLERAQPVIDEFFAVKRNDLVGAVLDAGVATTMTVEQLRGLADTAIDVMGIDITGSEFVRWVSGDMPMDGWLVGLRGATGSAEEAIGSVDDTWVDYIRNLEGGQDILDEFYEGSIERVVEFRDHMETAFEEVSESVRDGFPAWAEYEQVVFGATDSLGNQVTASLQDVTDAQDRFLEDLTAFADAMPLIMEQASPATLAWIESWDAASQGAFGRLTLAEQEKWIAIWNANWEGVDEQTRRIWLAKMPRSVAQGTALMLASLTTAVDGMGLPAQEAAEAYGDMLVQEIAALPEEYREDVVGYITELLGGDMGTDLFGEGITQDWIDGIIRRLKTLDAQVGVGLAQQSGKLKTRVDSLWGNKSPSKWWQQTGDNWIQGLEKGIKDGLPGISALLTPEMMLSPSMAGVSPSSSVTNNRSKSQTINLNFSSAARGTLPEVQTALTLLHLVSGVEGGHGRLN